MTEEFFKPINGYEGYYEISNLGRVKSCAKEWSVGRKGETFLKAGRTTKGYLRVTFCIDKIKNIFFIHRLVALHFCENKYSYPVVNHKDSNTSNNVATNLEWTTNSGNAIHGYMFGNRVSMKGNMHGRSKLTEDQVKEIRELRDKGDTVTAISKMFNISVAQTSKIVNRKKWAHI